MDGPSWPQVRVLVVDDSRDSIHVLGALLQTLGCAVTTCDMPSECVERARQARPHLILLDLAMPQKHGFDVAMELRQLELPPFYLVALTGYGGSTVEERCKVAGVDQHVLKPAGIDQLRELIRSARQVASVV